MQRDAIVSTPRLDRILVVLVLVASFSQTGLGARFSPSGEQVGAALPISSAILIAILIILLIRKRGHVTPLLNRWQTAFMALASVGILGLSRPEALGGIKEWVQLAEIVVLAPWVFRILADSVSRAYLRSAMGWAGFALLLLGGTPVPRCGVLQLSDVKLAAFVVLAWPSMLAVLRGTSAKPRIGLLAASGILVGLTFRHGGLLLGWLILTALALTRRFKLLSLPESVLCTVPAVALSLLPVLHAVSPWQSLNPRFDGQHLKRSAIEVQAAFRAPAKYPLGGGLGRYKPTINQLKQYGAQIPHGDDLRVPEDGNCQYLVTMVEAGPIAAVALLVLFFGSAVTALGTETRDAQRRAREPAVDALSLTGCVITGLFCVTLSRGTGIWIGAILGLVGHGALPVTTRKAWLRAAVITAVGGAAAVLMLIFNPRPDVHTGESHLNAAVRHLFARERVPVKPRVVILADADTGYLTGAIRVEAENCSSVVPPFVVVPANDASGGHALMVPDGAAKDEGKAVYSVNVPEAGIYALFARVLWADGCGNSIRFDVGATSCVLADDVFAEWHTLHGKRRVSLPAGTTHVVAHNLEDGIRIDYWGLRRVDAP